MNLVIALLFLVLLAAVAAFILRISSQVNQRLNQMTQSIQEANKIIAQNLNNTTSVFGNVREELGRLGKTNERIVEISKDISSLQELLRAPKFRGQMGETMLENLLEQVLPREHYQMQYRFKSGDAVDAIIRLGGRLVPVDAKFSLENFQKMAACDNDQDKAACRKKFLQDVKNRVEEIAAKYILPEENTFDFALMYIPAESVYYEAVIREDLLGYFAGRKVIPVSPNTFFAYLQVICFGLRGLRIEENAKQILKGLSSLSVEIDKFKEEFDVLGSHLGNARTKYEEAGKHLDKFNDKFVGLQETKQIESKA